MSHTLIPRYCRLLEGWHRFAARYRHVPKSMPDTLCYGTGYNKWGVQTQQKAFAATAVLAAAPELDEARAGQSRDAILDCALHLLRFSLRSHLAGDGRCLDGSQWGHTWISALGLERMMHGLEAINAHLSANDRALVRTVLLSECDWLVDHHPVVAHLEAASGENKPESNLWNGALLHRTALLYPDCPRAEDYRQKGTRFLVNGISVPADAAAKADGTLAGQGIRECLAGANFFPSYALNHHGYLNVGYMVVCLSQVAMLHFFCKARGMPTPVVLYRHVEDLWRLVRRCIFDDGRLLRIGGDTRVRYCYCQDYAIPMWLLMEDQFGDTACPTLEARWLEQVEKEVAANGDGSFLSHRLQGLEALSPLYFTRLESDRAVALAMGLHWRRMLTDDASRRHPSQTVPVLGGWHDAFHGACLQRDSARVASWTWLAAEKPQGLCLPPDRGDMAEWRHNLAGRISGLGAWNYAHVVAHREVLFPGGFLTWGILRRVSEWHMAEGQPDEVLAHQHLVFAALPDGHTVAVLQFAQADHRQYISEIKGIGLHLPNDLFNDMRRTYRFRTGTRRLAGCPGRAAVVSLAGPWVNVDNALSLVVLHGGGELVLVRPAERQIGLMSDQALHKSRGVGMLYADELCNTYLARRRVFDQGETLLDTGFLVVSGIDARQTRKRYDDPKRALPPAFVNGDMRCLTIPGMDGRTYLLAANFARSSQVVVLPDGCLEGATQVVDGQPLSAGEVSANELVCEPGGVRLLVLKNADR